MANEHFADAFGNITVTGTVVRIDLVTFSGQGADGKPQFERSGRIVLPLEGFLRSFSMCEDMVGKLVKSGVVNRKAPPAQPQIIETSAPPPGSPNFN
jgi:hypothetical protein